MGRSQQKNSGTTGGGFTLTGITRQQQVHAARKETVKPPQAYKGVRRPAK